MRINYFFSLMCLCTCMWACDSNDSINNGVQDATILVDRANKGDFQVEVEKVINLETTDESIFGELYKVIFTNDGIFVHDHIFTNNIYKFDGNGKFISKLETGKGPHEVLKVYSTYYDKETKELFVNDPGLKKIKIFDKDLGYKRSLPINDKISYHNFNRLRNKKWIVQTTYRNYPKNDTTARFVVLDSTFSQIEKKYLPFDLNFRSVSMSDPFSSNPQKEVLFCNVFDNNLYTLNNEDEIKIKYRVDFGKFNLTDKEIESSPDNIIKLWKEGERKTNLDFVKESNNYVGFSYLFEDGNEFCIYSKNSNRIISSEYLSANNFIPGRLVEVTDDHFVCSVEPAVVIKYLNESNKSNPLKSLKIKETDNPVLIIYSLKEELK